MGDLVNMIVRIVEIFYVKYMIIVMFLLCIIVLYWKEYKIVNKWFIVSSSRFEKEKCKGKYEISLKVVKFLVFYFWFK